MKALILTCVAIVLFLTVVFLVRYENEEKEEERERKLYGGLTRREFKEKLNSEWEEIWRQGMKNWLTNDLDAKEWRDAIAQQESTIDEAINYLWEMNRAGTLEYFDSRDGWRYKWFNIKLKEMKVSIKDKNIQSVINEIQNQG